MIFVHSKLMIVDDEYMLIGSANMNARSMAGNRDVETNIGVWSTDNKFVKKMRIDTWKLVFGKKYNRVLNRPESDECLCYIRNISKNTWKSFSDQEVTELDCFIMKYPIHVKKNGDVVYTTTVPDLGVSFEGANACYIPNMITV
jgi:phospholipase D1/2